VLKNTESIGQRSLANTRTGEKQEDFISCFFMVEKVDFFPFCYIIGFIL